ncbi:MAG: hypothetical protein WBD53_10490 [Xanthobacteraceae bacterium]
MTGRLDLEAQKLAIRMIHQLAAIKKMPAIKVRLRSPKEARPIVVEPIPNLAGDWSDFTIWEFLALDVEAAKAKGGTFADLLKSKRSKRQWPPTWDVEPPDLETLDNSLDALGLKTGGPPQPK